MSARLSKSIAIVTGASRGYGAGIAEALAAEGARVWITARSKTDLEQVARKTGATPIAADICSGEDWDRVFAAVLGAAGRVDILINNAGGGGRIDSLAELSDRDVEECLAQNLTGAILGCRRAAEVMQKQRSGTIVNISSVCAVAAWPKWGPYSAAKAGLVQFTKCLYAELRPFGARATCLIPSWGATNFTKAAGLPEFDPATAEQCIQPSDIGHVVANICALPPHLCFQELILWPLVQEVVPL